MVKKVLLGVILLLIIIVVAFLYTFNIIPHKKYNNSDFDIDTYQSTIDKDSDGTNDQTDILNNAKEYIKTKPKYKSKYYNKGYSDDEYGVCTDVVGFALKEAGYDLMTLVNDDIINNKDEYNIYKPDKNIDFRRVRNLRVYFERHAIKLTNDINNISAWQGGDIVIFKKHIGIVSDVRNKKGIPFIIHHASIYQRSYEEDILEYYGKVVGHYRIT